MNATNVKNWNMVTGSNCSGTETIISSNYPFNHEQDKSWLMPSLGKRGGPGV